MFNTLIRSTGTLWESRHKASLVDANMVKHPAEYKWSSYMHNAYGESTNLVSPLLLVRMKYICVWLCVMKHDDRHMPHYLRLL